MEKYLSSFKIHTNKNYSFKNVVTFRKRYTKGLNTMWIHKGVLFYLTYINDDIYTKKYKRNNKYI